MRKYILSLFFRKMLISEFLLRFKANYLEKMPGYPSFSLWIPIALATIYFFRVVLPVTYLLCSMWHIRPQHNPANHLCQPLPFVPHSSSSIPFFPFLSPPSLSMLSLIFPFFAAPLGPRLMQSCSHFVVLFS